MNNSHSFAHIYPVSNIKTTKFILRAWKLLLIIRQKLTNSKQKPEPNQQRFETCRDLLENSLKPKSQPKYIYIYIYMCVCVCVCENSRILGGKITFTLEYCKQKPSKKANLKEKVRKVFLIRTRKPLESKHCSKLSSKKQTPGQYPLWNKLDLS